MFFETRQGMKLMTLIHELWYRATNGVIGGNVFGTKILLLTTTGRKTGKRFTTPLTYLEDDADLVVIASNGGSDANPDWWLNLKAHPHTTVQVRGDHRDLDAKAVSAPDRERLWSMITERHPVYSNYERRTKREIPVVVLRPDSE